MFGDIPVLTRLYQLDNIRSVTENGLWPEKVRNFCTETVVDRQCHLTITESDWTEKPHSEPTLCKLEVFTREKDLASALVSRGLAEWIQKPNDTTASTMS